MQIFTKVFVIAAFIFPILTISQGVFLKNKETSAVTIDNDKFNYQFIQHPNVYYFLVDAYARDDTLLETRGYDNTPFLNALKKRLGWNSKPDVEMISKISNKGKGFVAYATFYLWRSLYD